MVPTNMPGGEARSARRDLIRAIQAARGSKVITYITSDRPMLSGQISEGCPAHPRTRSRLRSFREGQAGPDHLQPRRR